MIFNIRFDLAGARSAQIDLGVLLFLLLTLFLLVLEGHAAPPSCEDSLALVLQLQHDYDPQIINYILHSICRSCSSSSTTRGGASRGQK